MKSIQVKKLILGEGVPAIAVPVMAADRQGAAEKIADIRTSGADLIELRADAFPDLTDPDFLTGLLRDAAAAAGDMPLLFTLRTQEEGGLFRGGPDLYAGIVRTAAASGCADLLDIEMSAPKAEELLDVSHRSGVPVILSYHQFSKTDAYPELVRRFRAMESAGADIAKIACMPRGAADAGRMIAAGCEAGRSLGIPYIAISMGEAGRLTRTACAVSGSCLTFGALKGEASAPGQLAVPQLRRAMERIAEKRKGSPFVFLTGFMGTGKTTVAAVLAQRMQLDLIEMDELIEREEGRSIPSIFDTDGEEAFRDMETALIMNLSERPGAVVSCGGGSVLRPENRALMHALGTVVHLTASPDTIFKRLSGESEGRPNVRNRMSPEGIRELLEKRRPAYEAADFPVDTDGMEPEEIALQIMRLLRGA